MEGVLLAAYVGCQSCFNRSDRCIYWPEQGNCLPIFGAFSILLDVHCAPFLSFSTIYVLLQLLTLLASRMFWKGKGAFILGCTSPLKAIMIDRSGMGKVKNWRKSCAHCAKEPEKRSEDLWIEFYFALSEKWAVGVMGCRSNGLSELWAVGIMLRIHITHTYIAHYYILTECSGKEKELLS
jgi:hypothetical protein